MSPRLCCTLPVIVSLLVAYSALGQDAPQEDMDREPDRHHQLVQHLRTALPRFNLTTDLPLVRKDLGRFGTALPETRLSVDGLSWLLTQDIFQSWEAAANGAAGEWINETRDVYTRNSLGSATKILREIWHAGPGDWAPVFRQTNSLDQQNRVVQSVGEVWIASTTPFLGDWEPFERTSYTYDEQGNVTVTRHERWDRDAGEYRVGSRTTQTYEGSRLIQVVKEFGLEFVLRETFEYDSNGNATQHLHEDYEGGQWVNSGLRLWTYDSNGQELEDLEQNWDAGANGGQGAWVNDTRTVTGYAPDSSNPSEIVFTGQQWDPAANGGQGDWLNDFRYVTTLATGGGTTTLTGIYQQWRSATNVGHGDWLNHTQIVSTWNAGGEFVERLFREWKPYANGGLGDWADYQRFVFEYKDQGLIVEVVQNSDGADWVNWLRFLEVYQEFTGTAVESQTPSPSYALHANYPNPFQEVTSIDFKLPAAEHVTLEIFDLLGRRLMTMVDGLTSPGTHRVRLKAGTLAGGVYVYRLQGDQVNMSRTMLLVR